MTTGLHVLALGVSLLGAPSPAALDVGLEVDPCLSVPDAEVRRLAELELSTRVVSTSPGAKLAATVHITCLEDRAVIRATDTTTGQTLERTLEFTSSAPDVRARALALATAKLLLTHWLESARPAPRAEPAATTHESSKSPPGEQAAATPLVNGPAEHHSSARVEYLLAFAQASSTFELSRVGWGGGVRLGWISGLRWLGADFELSAASTTVDTTLGAVHTTVWSVAARPTLRLATRPLFVGVGLGARFGFARVAGTPNDPEQARGSVVAGSWGGPLAHAELGLESQHFFACAGVEAGYALKTVEGSVDGAVKAGVRGAFGSATFGLGWSF
jgi:hypothetical protein